jgi:hypothetical protein
MSNVVRMGRAAVRVAWNEFAKKDGKVERTLDATVVEPVFGEDLGTVKEWKPVFQGGRPVRLSGSPEDWDRFIRALAEARGQAVLE